MSYIVSIFLLGISVHLWSFAKYYWSNKNKRAAVGSAIMAVTTVVVPLIVTFIKYRQY